MTFLFTLLLFLRAAIIGFFVLGLYAFFMALVAALLYVAGAFLLDIFNIVKSIWKKGQDKKLSVLGKRKLQEFLIRNGQIKTPPSLKKLRELAADALREAKDLNRS